MPSNECGGPVAIPKILFIGGRMDIQADKWLLGMIVVPVLVGFFKEELMTLFKDWKIWKTRAANNGSVVKLLNPNTGSWATVTVLDFTWGFTVADRTVTFQYQNGDKETVPFAVWARFRKVFVE